jgi:hypothetical protein
MILVAYRHGLRASELCDLNGIRSSSPQGACTSGEPSAERRACIQCRMMRYALYGVCSASSRQGHMCFPPSGWSYGAQKLSHADCASRRPDQDAISHPRAHAATCLRPCTDECRPRHASLAGVARASQYAAHGALYRNDAKQVSRFLAELKLHRRLRRGCLKIALTSMDQMSGVDGEPDSNRNVAPSPVLTPS